MLSTGKNTVRSWHFLLTNLR